MKKSDASEPTLSLQNASFRDPAGFVFRDARGRILRQINPVGMGDYEFLLSSGLYEKLTAKRMLVPHKERRQKGMPDGIRIIQPEPIDFISYPFEWSFSALKDAALLTLRIQLAALEHGMTLKDASAYNVQFAAGKPIFIDTLSFERYEPDTPWQAYRQFCQHFLAPLVLMTYTEQSLSQLSRIYLDGVPLDVAASLLPARARLKPGVFMHIFLHARSQRAKATEHKRSSARVPQKNLRAILLDLQHTVSGLKPRVKKTEWGNYYDHTNYRPTAADQKAKVIKKYLQLVQPKRAVDLGGNNGRYSRLLTQDNVLVACADVDPNAVEANYQLSKREGDPAMLPLLVDLINPGGALGWENQERAPVHERLKADVALALALVHHLALSNNLPLTLIADYLSCFAPYLIIEFVPKSDSQVQKLLSTRPDIFPHYNEAGLEHAFSERYRLVEKTKIKGSKRTLYLFKRKSRK